MLILREGVTDVHREVTGQRQTPPENDAFDYLVQWRLLPPLVCVLDLLRKFNVGISIVLVVSITVSRLQRGRPHVMSPLRRRLCLLIVHSCSDT